MDRPSPSRSLDQSPAHDSAIGTPQKTGSSRVSSGTAPFASSPLAAPPTPPNTGQLQAQETPARPRTSPFDYAAAARRHALNAQPSVNSDTWPENLVPLPPSRPGSVQPPVSPVYNTAPSSPTSPTSPTSPSRQRVEENNVGGQVVHRVLSLPRRRRTPSLRNAPDLQWDLFGQPSPRFDQDEPGIVIYEDDIPDGRRESHRSRLSPVVERPSPIGERSSSTEERPLTPLLPPPPTREPATRDSAKTPEVTKHHDPINFSRPAPSPPVHVDPLAEYHPHSLSPLPESPDLHPQPYPGELEGHPAYPPQPLFRSTSSRATYSRENEDPSLSMAEPVSVRRLTQEDVQRSQITITSRDRERARQGELEPLFARERVPETPEQEQMRFVQELRHRAARRRGWEQRHPFKKVVKKAWGKVKGFFDF